MRKLKLSEWLAEGNERFGALKNWAFVCPACGHISKVQDFYDLNTDTNNLYDANDAYSNCIGRKNGKGEDGFKGIDKGFGCNWASYGLFGTLSSGLIVIHENGKETNIFEFAPMEGKINE